MNEKLNLVEILKDCPEGTELYSTIFGEVTFDKIEEDQEYPIIFTKNSGDVTGVASDGRHLLDYNGDCTLFPSINQRDWSKFKYKKPKFDPKTLKPFDKVLVKTGTKRYNVWLPDFISMPPNDVDDTILCMCIDDISMVIPYNNDTKHLIGTNDEAPEFYRYWED